MSDGHGSAPPVAADFTLSVAELKGVVVVEVRVMPSVGLPDGSVVASLNVTRASPISGWKTGGVEDLSALTARKSALSTAI